MHMELYKKGARLNVYGGFWGKSFQNKHNN